MLTVLRYVIMFFGYSACGWLGETIYKTAGAYLRKNGERRIINSGFLYGPVCPIYGFGGLFFTLCLVNTNLGVPFFPGIIKVFFLGLVVADIVEYLTSYIMEKLFHARWWDYTNNFLNLHGRICLKHSIYWGIGAVLFVYLIDPIYRYAAGFLSKGNTIAAAVGILVLFVWDLTMTVKATADLRSFTRKLKEVKDAASLISGLIKDSTENKAEKLIDALNTQGAKMSKYGVDFSIQFSDLKKQFQQLAAKKEPTPYKVKTRKIFSNVGNLKNRTEKWLQEMENNLIRIGLYTSDTKTEEKDG